MKKRVIITLTSLIIGAGLTAGGLYIRYTSKEDKPSNYKPNIVDYNDKCTTKEYKDSQIIELNVMETEGKKTNDFILVKDLETLNTLVNSYSPSDSETIATQLEKVDFSKSDYILVFSTSNCLGVHFNNVTVNTNKLEIETIYVKGKDGEVLKCFFTKAYLFEIPKNSNITSVELKEIEDPFKNCK